MTSFAPNASASDAAADDRSVEVVSLEVSGMKCAGCVRTVERALNQHSGVRSATVNLVTEVALVECEPSVSPDSLADTLTEAGFSAQVRSPHSSTHPAAKQLFEKQQAQTRQYIRQLTTAGALLLLSGLGHLTQMGYLSLPGLGHIAFHWGLATLALLFPGRSILVNGWQGLRRNAPNMNSLVGLGAVAAYTASVVALLFPHLGWDCFFDEPVMLVGFILLGRTLEQQARHRATAALHSLVSLQPATARLVQIQPTDGMQTPGLSLQIPADRVKVGECLQILPGEKIPTDGEIILGQTTIDESMLTGEPLPVTKQPGDFVAAGTLNQSGTIVLKTTRTGQDTTLAQIIHLVETAQTRKAPIQNLADWVAGYFTYGVMTIATLTFLFWYFIGASWIPLGSHMAMAHDMHSSLPASPLLLSLKLTIAVLVIACPCALGLATPTALLVGSGVGAERGLLIRGGDVLEKAHQLTTIVFDKTGTLTTGHPVVTECVAFQRSKADLIQLAASVEQGTRHPLANAIQQEAQRQQVELLPAHEFHTEPGQGVRAIVTGNPVVLGTEAWLADHGISATLAHPQLAELAAESTAVLVGVDGELAGLIAVRDEIRSDAKPTLDRLRQMGLKVMMLTGDRRSAAESMGRSLGLSAAEVLAEVPPAGKAAAVAQLQQQGRVAMVGDGINDAPALALADVGISLHSSTEIAVETADLILMRNTLSDVVSALCLSRATFNKIRQNLFWAIIYNLVGIPLAAGALLPAFGVMLSPAAAGGLMAFSSVSVVLNSLLLRRTFSDSAP